MTRIGETSFLNLCQNLSWQYSRVKRRKLGLGVFDVCQRQGCVLGNDYESVLMIKASWVLTVFSLDKRAPTTWGAIAGHSDNTQGMCLCVCVCVVVYFVIYIYISTVVGLRYASWTLCCL